MPRRTRRLGWPASRWNGGGSEHVRRLVVPPPYGDLRIVRFGCSQPMHGVGDVAPVVLVLAGRSPMSEIAKARACGPGPASSPKGLASSAPEAYRRSRHGELEAILPHRSDNLTSTCRPASPAGSTSRPGGPFQPVARRGFGMPRIGASALRRRRFAMGVRG